MKTIKIYDVISHRSIELSPEDVNIEKTRKFAGWIDRTVAKRGFKPGQVHEIHLHKDGPFRKAHKGHYPILWTYKRAFDMIVKKPRKDWK